MNRFTAVGLLLSLLIFGCDKNEVDSNNSPKEIASLNPIWTFSLHEGEVISNSNIEFNFVSENLAVLPTTREERHWLTAVDILTGEEKWSWSDIDESSVGFLDLNAGYLYNHLLSYSKWNNHYCIDLSDGRTKWKMETNSSFIQRTAGINDQVFLMGTPLDTLQEFNRANALFEFDLLTGENKQILLPNINFNSADGERITFFDRVYPLIHDGELFIIVTEGDPKSNWGSNLMLSLYNYSLGQWVYKRILVEEESGAIITNEIKVSGDTVYISVNNSIKAYNIWTGEMIWANSDLDGPLDFGSYLVVDDKVIANSRSGTVYIIDSRSGQTLSQTSTASNPSQVRYLDGIAYSSAGGQIHAIDTDTGKHVWRLNSPNSQYSYRTGTMYVLPSSIGNKGKVIVATPEKAYCYNAFQ